MASNLMITKFYTFSKKSSHITLSTDNDITNKLIHSKKDISLSFRSKYPNGVLFYESFYTSNNKANVILELFLSLNQGRFKVLINSEGNLQELIVGYGFNKDHLHHVRMYMNLELGFFNFRINSTHDAKFYKSVYFNSTLAKQPERKLNYNLILGGHPKQSIVGSSQSYIPFIGCIGNLSIVSRSTSNNFDTLSSTKLEFTDVEEGCIDRCIKNMCSRRSKCVSFYDTKKCNCFGSILEDWHCRSYNYTVVTLRGYSHISYKIYKFSEKYYSDSNLISFHLKTSHNGLLFVGLAENLKSYLIINIKNGFLNLLFDFGNNPKSYVFNNFQITDNQWHNVTIEHNYNKIHVFFDMTIQQVISVDDANPYFFFDPEIFIGGLPSNLNITQLNLPIYLPNNRFVGCLKHVYFNRFNILYDLNHNSKMAKYFSILPLELGCSETDSVPLTFNARSYFRIPFNNSEYLLLQFQYRTYTEKEFKIVKGNFQTLNKEKKKWHLLIKGNDVKLTIEDANSKHNQLGSTLSNDDSLNSTEWNKITVNFRKDGIIEMIANEIMVKSRYDSLLDFGTISFGSFDDRWRFIGCAKEIFINGKFVEPRTLTEQYSVYGKVTLDGCQLVNPCDKPKACEHDGVCRPSFDNGTYSCDCSNTGYIGKTCHFSLYRKSCEEIHLMDKRDTGIYLIDIDRNGDSPPAHVICDIENESDGNTTIRTVIEHNIQHQVIVREKGKSGHFYMDVFYRDFTKEMLRLLIQRSSQCQQYLRYECNNAPLSLSTYTLLYSNKPEHKLVRLDSNKTRGCLCAGKCVDPSKDCNCDANLPGWKHDEGYLTSRDDVGISKMYFLQFPNASWDSEAHLYLGNLSCRDYNTQKYEITFKTKESYLEVAGWSGKEMAISFKTTANKAVIFYQSHLDTTSTYFKAVIISENEISFEYCSRNRKSIVTLSSSRCLNCGQWQHLLIERNQNQMRVSINQNFKILYLKENENFIDFDGKLYVGGAPLKFLKGLEITHGFIGCLRGLVFDNDIIDLHQYLSVTRYPNIESGCRPYCKPNLCKNQGICIELWGSYRCECANPIAHSGRNCEININENAITLNAPTYLRTELAATEIKNILQKDIVLSFRTYEKSALLLYAHDQMNNFFQIHIANGSSVVFSYNYYRKTITQKINIGNNLVSGIPVQIKIARQQRNNTQFKVNKDTLLIPYSVKLMKESFKWNDDTDPSVIRWKNRNKNEIFIGGIESSDDIINQPPGFIGCIQGLMVGGQLFDLEMMAQAIKISDSNQSSLMKPGCNMLCDNVPCNNGGICTENWLNQSTICDCEVTSYRGETCDVDIGAHFQKDSSVIYHLDNKIMDFQNIDISFAFSSSFQESSTLLMIRYANSTRFLHISLSATGKLFVEEDNGHEMYKEIIESEEDNFFDSYRHWVRYTRNGKTVKIIVDSIIYEIEEYFRDMQKPKTMPNIDENIIIIGSNKVNNQNFSSQLNFRGCISNLNIILDDLKIDPFESAFGISGDLIDVQVNGPIKQGICASFRIQQKINVPMMRLDQTQFTLSNREEIWFNRPKPRLIAFKMKNTPDEDKNYMSKSNIVIIVSSIYLCVVIICVSIYLCKIEKRYRLLKFQGETPFFHKNQMNFEKNYIM